MTAARANNRKWAVAAAIAALLVTLYPLRIVLLPFVFAAALAYIAGPPLRWLQRAWHLPRWAAATVVFLLYLILLVGAGTWIRLVLVPDAVDFAERSPALAEGLVRQISGSDHLHIFGQRIDAVTAMDQLGQGLVAWAGGTARIVAGAFGAIMLFFVTIFLLLFFLISGPRLARGALWLVPPSLRPHVRLVAERLHPVLIRYIVGMLIIVVVTALLCWVGTGPILGLRHATLISLAVGVLELIPVVGPILSAALLGMIAVARGELSIVIGVALFALALRLFIDQLMGPIILGRAVTLHPAVIIFAFLAGGALYGILGVLLAVPVAATIKISLQVFYPDSPEP